MALAIPCMDWTDPDLGEAMTLFHQKMDLYLADQNITYKEAKARKISLGAGDKGLRRLNASGLSADGRKDPDKLCTFFEAQLKVNVNFRIPITVNAFSPKTR